MIIKTEDLKKVTDNILPAVDSSIISNITENIELYTENNKLYICVTNKEYYVKSLIDVETEEKFHATVNAMLFLKLISQITTDEVELTTDERVLHIKGNGTYKIPLIYEGDSLLVLPKIIIENKTCEMNIKTEVLNSILKYNSKALSCGVISRPVQKMYYVDEEGAITFTTGACVNSFKLEKPVKMLLNSKIVKLFKLFKGDEVKFSLGYDALSETIIQTKVCFTDGETELTAILQCDDSMLKSVPTKNIRGRAENTYPYSVVISKNSMLQAINRLSLLMNRGTSDSFQFVAKFYFEADGVTISDDSGENSEKIGYANNCESLQNWYTAIFDLSDIKNTLSACDDAYLTFNFGDEEALRITERICSSGTALHFCSVSIEIPPIPRILYYTGFSHPCLLYSLPGRSLPSQKDNRCKNPSV